MTQEKMQEFRSVVEAAIVRGAARVAVPPLLPIEVNRIKDARKIENQRKRREAWVKAGLTSKGQPRTRGPRLDLTGWTPEQKAERLKQQKRDWNKRNRQ